MRTNRRNSVALVTNFPRKVSNSLPVITSSLTIILSHNNIIRLQIPQYEAGFTNTKHPFSFYKCTGTQKHPALLIKFS